MGLPLGLLIAKTLAQGIVGLWPHVAWASLHGLRILYLHTMLLGFVVLGAKWMYLAVLVLLVSLLPLTML